MADPDKEILDDAAEDGAVDETALDDEEEEDADDLVDDEEGAADDLVDDEIDLSLDDADPDVAVVVVPDAVADEVETNTDEVETNTDEVDTDTPEADGADEDDDDEGMDLDDEQHPDDVEEPLDVLLKERTAKATLEDNEEVVEEDEGETDERGEASGRIVPRRPGEFLCTSCFLVLPRHQLADPERMLCRDCV